VVLRLMVGSNAGTAFGRTFGMAEAEVWVDDGGCHSWGRSKCRGLCYDEKIRKLDVWKWIDNLNLSSLVNVS
jgi:hypothetical protein